MRTKTDPPGQTCPKCDQPLNWQFRGMVKDIDVPQPGKLYGYFNALCTNPNCTLHLQQYDEVKLPVDAFYQPIFGDAP